MLHIPLTYKYNIYNIRTIYSTELMYSMLQIENNLHLFDCMPLSYYSWLEKKISISFVFPFV